MEDLIPLVERCEEDTRRWLGHLAAERLGNWRRYATDERKLIGYIQRFLRGEHCQNGKKLDQQNALSLERIVLDHRPDLFCAEDRQ